MQPKLTNWLTSSEKQVNNTAIIGRLLADGSTQAQVARALKLSRPFVNRVARDLVKQGILIRSGRYPVLFSFAPGRDVNQISAGCDERPPRLTSRIWSAHNFAVSFLLTKRLPVITANRISQPMRGGWRVARWFEPEFTIEAYPNRVKIYLLNSGRGSVEQQFRNGIRRIAARAKGFSAEHGTRLIYDRVIGAPDWVMDDKEMSAFVQATLKLVEAPLKLPEAEVVVDRSHPEQVEIRGGKSTDYAKVWEWYLTEVPQNLVNMSKQIHDLTEIVQKQTELIARLSVK